MSYASYLLYCQWQRRSPLDGQPADDAEEGLQLGLQRLVLPQELGLQQAGGGGTNGFHLRCLVGCWSVVTASF